MAWESSRPVPWGRLLREWVIYAGVMAVAFVVLFRDSGLAGIMAGLLLSLPLYLGLGWVLAKLGYSRTPLRRRRSDGADVPPPPPAPTTPQRQRPAATRRTTTGPSQRPRSSRKRR